MAFARNLLRQGECPDCMCRALVFAAMALAHETDGVPAIHATLVALVRAMEREATVAAVLPH